MYLRFDKGMSYKYIKEIKERSNRLNLILHSFFCYPLNQGIRFQFYMILRLLLKLIWCLPRLLFEKPAEIRTVRKAKLKGDFLNGMLTVYDQPFGLQNDTIMDDLRTGFVQFIFENLIQALGADIQFTGIKVYIPNLKIVPFQQH